MNHATYLCTAEYALKRALFTIRSRHEADTGDTLELKTGVEARLLNDVAVGYHTERPPTALELTEMCSPRLFLSNPSVDSIIK